MYRATQLFVCTVYCTNNWQVFLSPPYLRLEQLVQICLHEALHDVDVPHGVLALGPEDVPDVDDVLVAEAGEDLDLPERALAVGLVLEG